MNEEYTPIILEKLYDMSLRMALRVTDNYEKFRNKSFVSERLMKKDFVIAYLDGVRFLLKRHNEITPTFKYNVLCLLNDIRFNYPFSSAEEKCYINKRVNETIILVNSADVFDLEAANFLKEEELVIANMFNIIHYYLTDEDTYKKEGIPFLQENEYYEDSLCFLLKMYPILLQEPLFLKRTYMLLNPDIEKIDEKEEKHIKKLKKNLTKKIRKGR